MNHLFLLGCHRSGTTMLQQALNRHSQIAIPPETKYFSNFVGHSLSCQVRRLQRINKDLQINLPAPARAVRRDEDARQFYELMARAYLMRLQKGDIAYFGEKTPTHSGYVSHIGRVFSRCKFLWIYRDGRDVAASMRRMHWMSDSLSVNFMSWLFYYKKQIRAARDQALDIHFVKYEDLAADPDPVLRRICAFLDLPFEPAMAHGHGNQEGVLDWELPWKGLALARITTKRIESWRDELTLKEVELLEWLGGPALAELGYPLSINKPRWSNVVHYPAIALGMLRFVRRIPLDELANQFIGRPICLGRPRLYPVEAPKSWPESPPATKTALTASFAGAASFCRH